MSETVKPASDLPTRVAMGVAMIAVASVAVVVGGWPFRTLVATAAAVMMIEWGDMHRVERMWSYAGSVLLAVLLLGVAEWLFPVADAVPEITALSMAAAWPGFGIAAAGAVLLGLLSRRVAAAAGFLYIALPAFALLVLDWLRFDLAVWAMVVTWATDIFAYFAGRAIGGPKLAPQISPNKTWAGLGGGVLGAAVSGAIVATGFGLGSLFVLVGALMGLIAQAGDLFESWLKRRAGVKDSSSLLPGHGGVLDRLDGLLPVVVATFLLLFLGLAPE